MQQLDPNTLIMAVPGTAAAVIAWLSLRQSQKNAKHVEVMARAVDSGNAEVTKLKENVDGKMDELKSTIARANLAEGRAEGIEAERVRPPDLVTEPLMVDAALHDADVRKQIDAIETAVTEKKGNGVGQK